jgi:hypothetical protein
MRVYIKHDDAGNILGFGSVVAVDDLGAGGPLELVQGDPRATVTKVDLPDISEELTEENRDDIADSVARIMKRSRFDVKSQRLIPR